MIGPLTGLGMIAGLAAELVGLRSGSRVKEIAEKIVAQTEALQEQIERFHHEMIEAIENQPDHAVIKDLISDLPQRLGATRPEAQIKLKVLDVGKGGGITPSFHRRINDPGKRRTDGMEITGTAFVFDLRIENNGEKRTIVEDVSLRATLPGEVWLVEKRATETIEGVRIAMPASEKCLKPGDALPVEPRGYVDKRIFLVTDRVVPDDVREIKGEVACKPKWGTSAPVRCTFSRTRER